MNPGLVVKLRPTGPWRIGPDSGARNRVDFIYHSDSLYSAVTSAMVKFGSLEEWLSATVRAAAPEVCFSSCFPFLDEIGFVVPPRTIWPPASPNLMAARLRWKSARFVPLGIVQAILAGKTLKEQHWSVDGPSQCLVPNGRPGPFRTDTRWSAAVDRMTGSSERHSTTCIEFRPGAGLWTVVSFRDEAARDRWIDPVKAAFRLLADTGFGGERSRGWGRAETPEFIDGQLPDMILPPMAEKPIAAPVPEPEPELVEGQASVEAPAEIAAMEMQSEGAPPVAGESPDEPVIEAEPAAEPAEIAVEDMESEGAPVVAGEPAVESVTEVEAPAVEAPAEVAAQEMQSEGAPVVAGEATPEPVAEPETPPTPDEVSEAAPAESAEEPASSEVMVPPLDEPAAEEPAPAVKAPAPEPVAAEPPPAEPEPPTAEAPAPVPMAAANGANHHWLLSLFSPAPGDTVDWTRGAYATMTRGGRVESPSGSGELKKLVQMVAEGSVLYGSTAPTGAAPDVAPDGFAHPVFRAGFAVAIPLPGVRS